MLYGTWLWGLQSVMSLPDAPAVLMSSLSCALSIGAAHFLFDALAPALVDPWTGALLATAFALSPAVWEYGMQVEVFALHNFLLSMLVWFTMRCLRTPYRLRDVLSAAFVCGLAMSNQHTSIVFIVPVAASVVVYHSLWRRLPLIILCFVAGVAPYAFLPLSTPSARSWGRHDTLAGFLAHVLRSTYGSAKMVQDQNSTDIRKNLSETVPVFLDHLSDTRGMYVICSCVDTKSCVNPLATGSWWQCSLPSGWSPFCPIACLATCALRLESYSRRCLSICSAFCPSRTSRCRRHRSMSASSLDSGNRPTCCSSSSPPSGYDMHSLIGND